MFLPFICRVKHRERQGVSNANAVMAKESNWGWALLLAVVVVGGLVVVGDRYPGVRLATDVLFESFEILLAVGVVLLLAVGWYLRRKYPELAAQENRRPSNEGTNPHRNEMLAAVSATAIGFGGVVVSIVYAFRDPLSAATWVLLVVAATLLAGTLLFALPRIRRFARYSAERIIRDFTDPRDGAAY